MSIQDDPARWAETALEMVGRIARQDNSGLIRANGYDIRESYAWMQRFYLNKIENAAK